MLQRIQTLYLFISAILSSIVIYMVPLWKDKGGMEIFESDVLLSDDWRLVSIAVAFILSGILSFLSIFMFKNRSRQIGLNRFNIVINFYLLGIIVYYLLMLPGESQISEKGIGIFIPIIVIVLLALANKSIIKDEKLVKSVDRLR